MSMWLILSKIVFLSQCNMKIVRYLMTLILDVGRNMKWSITLNIYLIPLMQIDEIKYSYRDLNQPINQNIVWRVTILFISQRLFEKGCLLRSK